MSKETLRDQSKTAEYAAGTIDYSVLPAISPNRPVLIVNGFTEDRFVMQNFAHQLNETGKRTVIFTDQPEIDPEAEMSAIDYHAEALLAVIEAEELTDTPVDIVAHSMGSLVTARMAELAKQRGITCFDSERGSRSVFISPGGSNSAENLAFLAGRFAEFGAKYLPYAKELDPTGEMGKTGTKNFFRKPIKTAKEVLALSKKEQMYRNLGNNGLRPFVLGYPADYMFPHRVIGSTMKRYEESIEGYAMPIDNDTIGADSFDTFKQKTGLKGKTARRAWAWHYRNAGHNDLLFNPKRTARSVVQILG